MNKLLWMVWNNKYYIVKVPKGLKDSESYHHARKMLKVPDNDITPWDWLYFDEKDTAPINWNLKG